MSLTIRVLYIDDYPLDRALVRHALEQSPGLFAVTEATCQEDFQTALTRARYDIVISDFNILGFSGLDVIDLVRAHDPRLPVVIVTGTGSEKIAVEAMKRGATDYVIKTPRDIQRLPGTVLAALEKERVREARERAEQDQERATAEQAAILDQMADGVLVVDPQGRILTANQRLGLLAGLPPGSIVGTAIEDHPWQLFDVEGRACRLVDQLRDLARGSTEGDREYRLRAADGIERWVLSSAALLRRADGEVFGAVVSMRDHTEEHARRQQAAAGEKLRALGQLASGVAHDLNQYLGLVVGHTDLALQQLERLAPESESLKDLLNTINEAALDGAETVRRLLAFSHPRAAELHTRLDLAELLEEVAKLTAPRWRDAAQADGRPINLTVDAVGDTTVVGGHASLREALTNLIFNAVDAMPDGGTIRLVARHLADRVTIEVSDTGDGMSAEVQSRAFEPFFTTKGEQGTGLGLPMVFRLVEQHHGTIALDSLPGRGTTLQLSFPAAPPAALAEPVQSPEETLPPLRLLVVDDVEQLGQMLARLLSRDGHQVEVATSGEAALQRLLTARFDVVISDVAMGDGMNGWQLAEASRKLRPDLPFILATGWGAQIDPEQARDRGVVAVLAKPYGSDELRRTLARAIRGPAAGEA